MDFETFEVATRKSKKTKRFVTPDTTILCFDPGHTTGFAIFQGLDLIESGELVTKPIDAAVRNVERMFNHCEPDIVVMEDYRVYKWKTEHHGGSELLTTRVIGCIETFCVLNFVSNVIKQPAHIGKGFATDKRLREWGFYKKGERHARDAIRHGCYFLLFGAIRQSEAYKLRNTVG